MHGQKGRVARSAFWLVGVLGTLYVVLLFPGLSGEIRVPDPRIELDAWPAGTPGFPAVVRYVSSVGGFEGKTCFGLLVESRDGVPIRVLNLNAVEPGLGQEFLQFATAGGFDLAEEIWSTLDSDDHAAAIEQLPPGDLGRVILSPVDIDPAELRRQERIVVGVGFNYAAHREETASEHVDRFAFAKMVVPTGAYAPLELGGPSDQSSAATVLGDYEVELGFVVMDDIDLHAPPADRAVLLERVAFFNANDVTDRWPIIVEGDAGFTRGKSRPGYLPLGPWMIHGKHLDPTSAAGGEIPLRMSLGIDEGGSGEAASGRQDSVSTRMIRGPMEILAMLEEIAATSRRTDWDGAERGIATDRGGRLALPAGSIVLTGTPVGTAIEAPRPWDKVRLLVRNRFSPAGARQGFAAHCARNHRAMGFLSHGDVVEARIQHLGTQRWVVRQTSASQP